jgi:hypothetical protein
LNQLLVIVEGRKLAWRPMGTGGADVQRDGLANVVRASWWPTRRLQLVRSSTASLSLRWTRHLSWRVCLLSLSAADKSDLTSATFSFLTASSYESKQYHKHVVSLKLMQALQIWWSRWVDWNFSRFLDAKSYKHDRQMETLFFKTIVYTTNNE